MHRVLIVEDDPFMLDSMRRHITRTFEVETAENGHDGILKLKEHGPFGAVVSDLRMRGMSGIEFLEAACGIAPDTPRILFTGYADRENMAQAINRASVHRILEKPMPPIELIRNITDCVERFEATKALSQQLSAVHNANETKSGFLMHVSHELKTPLNAIIGFSEFIISLGIKELGDSRVLEYLSNINSSGKNLLDKINNILEISSLCNNNEDFDVKSINVVELVQDLINLIEQDCQKKM